MENANVLHWSFCEGHVKVLVNGRDRWALVKTEILGGVTRLYCTVDGRDLHLMFV